MAKDRSTSLKRFLLGVFFLPPRSACGVSRCRSRMFLRRRATRMTIANTVWERLAHFNVPRRPGPGRGELSRWCGDGAARGRSGLRRADRRSACALPGTGAGRPAAAHDASVTVVRFGLVHLVPASSGARMADRPAVVVLLVALARAGDRVPLGHPGGRSRSGGLGRDDRDAHLTSPSRAVLAPRPWDQRRRANRA
jgi:hypothetical protein